VLRGLAEEIDQDGDQAAGSTAERREGLEEMLPVLRTWRAQGRSRAFMSFLVPVVETIGPYVQRELRIREYEGRLNGEEISASDVLDDVLIQAWDRFNGPAKETPLDLWLVRLADEIMDRLGSQRVDESLDDECVDPSRESRESLTDEWIEQASYPETIELSELLSDGPGVDSWDDLELETKQAHLAAMLGQLEREQRQAFVLNVAHGFDPATIADFQNRPVDQVEVDIAQATAEIRRYLMDEQTPDREEPFAQAEIREQRRKKR
jgi:DNA-directed RNA polymerase specialized sigma24 family protein